MVDLGPFPADWFFNPQRQTEMLAWFPLPLNLVNKGEEWVAELQINATVIWCFVKEIKFYIPVEI